MPTGSSTSAPKAEKKVGASSPKAHLSRLLATKNPILDKLWWNTRPRARPPFYHPEVTHRLVTYQSIWYNVLGLRRCHEKSKCFRSDVMGCVVECFRRRSGRYSHHHRETRRTVHGRIEEGRRR